MEADDVPPGYFIGRPFIRESDDDLPSGVTIGPGGYFTGRPAKICDMEADDVPPGYFIGRPFIRESDDDLISGVAIGPGGYFTGRPASLPEGGRPTRYNFLKLVRDKLGAAAAALTRDAAAATVPSSEVEREAAVPSSELDRVPSELGSELIKEMENVMTVLKGVDRRLLETACLEISNMVDDELQANKAASIPAGTSKHGGPKITIAEKMKNIIGMLEKIDWQLYGRVERVAVPGYYADRVTQPRPSPSNNNGGVILKRTSRIFVDLERLVDLLLLLSSTSSSTSSRQPVVLPIVGLAGIGKTTLAKLVYCHTKFKDYHHDSKAWIPYPRDGLFHEQLPRRGANNKVLVVLDGLQENNNGDRLLDVKRILIRDVGKNAIVIVTTRSEDAAKKICTVEPYKLHADMCFATIKPADELPAAGGYTDSTLCRALEHLKESYNNLMPPDVVECFKYCAIFPEGHNIVKDDIIHQWMALHLLVRRCDDSCSSNFEIGEGYIRKLLDISFLQPATKLPSTSEMEYMGGTSFTMHAVVHSLARSEAADVVVLDGRNGNPSEKKHCKYGLLTNFDVTHTKLSNILAGQVMALLLLDCSKMELIDSSFSFAKGLRVLNIREPSMKKLPSSICQLTQLTYLNLSGCSGLIKLPESFGNLTSMVYINLSGCSGIKNLPKSFGNLINVVHVNLSGCHGLDDLPQSFCKLWKLEYLDLSFCSCVKELTVALLADLTNLRHLNLSHPCYYAVEHKDHLEQLKNVWAKLTKLQYLNLSMFMNPIFCYLPEGETLDCFRSIECLSSLGHLDLSHNIFLDDLPDSLGGLNKLHTLHLSGCIRLKKIAKKITEMKCLKNIVLRKCPSLSYSFPVRTDDDDDEAYSSNIIQLEDVTCKELEISCLEKVRSTEEARSIRLNKKRKLEKLTLVWTKGCYESFVDDEALLAELVPPQNLQCFELKRYRGKLLPAWLTSSISSHLANLVRVSMEGIPNCSALPPLFLLPNLKQVALRNMASITKVDAGELSGGNKAALHRLRQFTLEDLENLQEFSTIYCSGNEELMFPIIGELVIHNCPRVKFVPLPPTTQRLHISACDQVMSSLPKTAEVGEHATGVEASSSTSMASARVTQLVVENCKVSLGDWSLLHHLPGLRTLEIWNCNDLTSSPETIRVISSLQTLCFKQCIGMTSLPEYLGDLTSIRQFILDRCEGIQSLPQSIDKLSKLKVLGILECPELKNWCELEGNKKKLAHIQIIYEREQNMIS